MKQFMSIPQLMVFIQLIFSALLFVHSEKRRSACWLRGAASLAAAGIVLVLYQNIPVLEDTLVKSIFSYFVTYYLVVLFVWSVYCISVVDAIFISSCAYALQHIAFCINGLLPFKVQVENEILLSTLWAVLLSLIFYMAVLRGRLYIYHNVDVRRVFLSMAILFICIALNSMRKEEGSAEQIYTNLYDLLLCFCCLMLQFSMSYSAKIHEEKATLELLISQQHEQHKLSNQAFSMMNLKLHNIRHQLSSIQQMMEEKDSEKLQPFLRTLKIYDTMANTGNPTIDSVLMEKGLMCEINQIHFSFIVDGKQMEFMEISDLFSLVNNILDNAIECEIKEADPECRIINLRVVRKHDMVLLDAENYCRYPVQVNGDEIPTTKADKENHGIGMRGIHYVVNKYGGEIQFKQEDDFFRLSIVFPVKNE